MLFHLQFIRSYSFLTFSMGFMWIDDEMLIIGKNHICNHDQLHKAGVAAHTAKTEKKLNSQFKLFDY